MGRTAYRRVAKTSWPVGLGLAVAYACVMAMSQGGDSAATDPPPSSSSTSSATPSATSSPTGATADRLETLTVKGRAPMTGYEREEQFGQSWSDDVSASGGRNGCDQRNDVLRRDLDPIEVKPGTNGCVALGGELDDPYSGTSLTFEQGEKSGEVPVDHVVSLGNAWATGAQALTPEQRQELANDPVNLQPTTRTLNSQKGDGDAATWLPPATEYRCTYIARQIEVKARYELWVTQPEKDAMERVLRSCAATSIEPATWDVPEVAK